MGLACPVHLVCSMKTEEKVHACSFAPPFPLNKPSLPPSTCSMKTEEYTQAQRELSEVGPVADQVEQLRALRQEVRWMGQ